MTDKYKPDRDYRPPDQLTDDELVARVKHRNKATEIPPCRICGGPLEVQAAGGGHPTVYACSTQEDDPDNPDRLRYKEGRKVADDHYRDSRFEDPRHTDPSARELARRFEVLRREVETDLDKRELAAFREDRDRNELVKAAEARGRWYEVVLKVDGLHDFRPWHQVNNRDMRVIHEITCPACVVELADKIKIENDRHTCEKSKR
jgi:hypothetical protein